MIKCGLPLLQAVQSAVPEVPAKEISPKINDDAGGVKHDCSTIVSSMWWLAAALLRCGSQQQHLSCVVYVITVFVGQWVAVSRMSLGREFCTSQGQRMWWCSIVSLLRCDCHHVPSFQWWWLAALLLVVL